MNSQSELSDIKSRSWKQENRLPTHVETKNERKHFPEVEVERKMRELFFEEFRPIVTQYLYESHLKTIDSKLKKISCRMLTMLHRKIPSECMGNLTQNQIELVLSISYGVYFYNFIAGGRVIENFSEVNFSDWLEIDWTNSEPYIAHAAMDEGRITIYYSNIPDVNPDDIYYGYPTELAYYQSTRRLEYITTGIEEASHLDFWRLRYKRANRGKKKIGFEELFDTYEGPLKQYMKRDDKICERLRSKEQWAKIDYDSLLDDEFAAQVVTNTYVKCFFPEFWKLGFENYYLWIRKRRRIARKKFNKKMESSTPQP